MLTIEGIDGYVQRSRAEWEEILHNRFSNKYLQAPDGALVKPERIAIWPVGPGTEWEVRLVTGKHVLRHSLEEFLSKFTELQNQF